MFALGSSMAGQRFDGNSQSGAVKERLRTKGRKKAMQKNNGKAGEWPAPNEANAKRYFSASL